MLGVLLLSGCVSTADIASMAKGMYNIPSSGTSQFDGTKHIRVSKMLCSSIEFELYQGTNKSNKGIVLLKAGSNSIVNIGDGQSLHIKLDDDVHSFKASSTLTEHETGSSIYGVSRSFSSKTYMLPEAFVRKVAASKVFLAKIHFLNSSYIEGQCSTMTFEEAQELNKDKGVKITQEHVNLSNSIVAVTGFRQFVNMMDSTEW